MEKRTFLSNWSYSKKKQHNWGRFRRGDTYLCKKQISNRRKWHDSGRATLCNHVIELYDLTIVIMDLHCDNIGGHINDTI